MQKIPVAILGATGLVGQKLIELLIDHPWFEIEVLAASKKSAHRRYGDVVKWTGAQSLPLKLREKKISECIPTFKTPLVFSALDSSVAFEIETRFLEKGYHVISNAKNFRNYSDVPLIIPEVNPSHIVLIEEQKKLGKIITNPNCAVAGLALALKPLFSMWGIERVHVCTLQAISGAGLSNLAASNIEGNIIPHIEGEESKVENEPKKILGSPKAPASISISAQCNRVPVLNGHFMNVSLKLEKEASIEDVRKAWLHFQSPIATLPSALKNPFIYFDDILMPQPKLHQNLANGMGISIGKLQKCSCHDYKFNLLVNNLVRGAAGASLLNAELFVDQYPGYFQVSKSAGRAFSPTANLQ